MAFNVFCGVSPGRAGTWRPRSPTVNQTVMEEDQSPSSGEEMNDSCITNTKEDVVVESRYLKILKKRKREKLHQIILKIPLLHMQKNIILYTHKYIYIYFIHNCSNL